MVQFKDLWANHPTNVSDQLPCRTGLGFPTYKNQCAIRVGIALKRAGVTYNQLPPMITCGVHKKEEMHYIRAEQLARGLASVGGRLPGLAPVRKVKDPKNFHRELYGKTGVIFFRDYWRRRGETYPTGDHIDVWNGYRTSAKWLIEWFSWLGYTENYGFAREVWFWEVK